MKSPLVLAAGILAMALAVPTAPDAANSPPAFADYLNRIPTVVGSVTASDVHSVTLATESGDPMSFIIDSRSVVPAELPAGARVRVEFHALSADAFHARRITPLTGAEIRALEEQAAPRMRADSEPAESASEGTTSVEPVTESPAEESAATAAEPTPTGTAPADETASQAPAVTPPAAAPAPESAPVESKESGQLPRTAGSLPLVGMLGGAALAAAVGIGFWRRRRRV